jgi:hypothetical protein
MDGVATRISRSTYADDLATRLVLPERAAERAARLVVSRPAAADDMADAAADADTLAVEVTTATEPESGLFESIVGAVIGFLFG